MADTTAFRFGAEVSCADGVCGEVTRVIVDPVARAVTHLAVDRHGLGRLVPLGLVGAATGGIRLRCTLAEFERLDSAETTQVLSGDDGENPYQGPEQIIRPYYSMADRASMHMRSGNEPHATVAYDSVPSGKVSVGRGEHVHASDGDIGLLQGLVTDPRTGHVTHALLQEGHLWGRKEVAIPIGAVTGVDDGIRLSITKQQVQDLPPVNLGHADS